MARLACEKGTRRHPLRAPTRRALPDPPARARISVRALIPGLHLPARHDGWRRADASGSWKPRAPGARLAPPGEPRYGTSVD
jgi:hypothetical protein